MSGHGAGWKLGDLVRAAARTSLPLSRQSPQSVLLPVREVTIPNPAVSLARVPHLERRFFPDPSPIEVLGQ